ncbi:MAG: hypothetical protein U0992_09890 [Planctomycetaceae bacterium]
MSRLEYMGSALVALVVRVWKAVQNGGGKVVVVCGGGMPQEVLRLAGLDKVWTIVTTYEDGLRKLGISGPSGGSSFDRGGMAGDAATGFPLLAVLSATAPWRPGFRSRWRFQGRLINRDLIVAGLLGGGVAAVLGFVSVIKERSWGRIVGGLAAVAGVAIAFAGYSKLPPAGGAATPPAKQDSAQPAAEKSAANDSPLFRLKDAQV